MNVVAQFLHAIYVGHTEGHYGYREELHIRSECGSKEDGNREEPLENEKKNESMKTGAEKNKIKPLTSKEE